MVMRATFRPRPGRALTVFLVATAGFVLSMFYRVSATIISPELSAELHLDASQLSALSAAFFYAFALFQIPAGPLLDRLGARRLMLAMGLVAITGAVVFALSQGYAMALAGRVLLGLGMAVNLMGAYVLLTSWFPSDRFATLAGVQTAVGNVGMTLATTPLAWLAVSWGWRGAFLGIAGLNAVQVVMLWAVVRDRPVDAPAPPVVRNGLRDIGRGLYAKPYFWAISMGMFFRFGAFMGVSALWAGPYLMQGHGLDPVRAGNILLACSVGMISGMSVCGYVSDRLLHTRKWIAASYLLAAAGLFALLATLGEGTPQWVLLAVFFAIGLASSEGQVMYTQIKELAPPGMAASGLTGINLFNMLGPAVMLQAGALLAPADLTASAAPGDFAGIWWLYAAGLAVSGVLYVFLVPESRPN